MNEHNYHEVLLVEDNDADVELTMRALDLHHVADKVFVVHDGAEALEYLFATGRYASRNIDAQPRVVLLDLKLPKVDGREVLRQIKADARTRSIPVVITTSSEEVKDINETYALGVNSYIQKPVDFELLKSTLANAGLYWLELNKTPHPHS